MKEIKVIVKNNSELELLEDASKGDIINLKKLNEIDLSFLETLIDEGRDNLYKSRLSEFKKSLDLKHELNLQTLKNEANLEISKLNEQLKNSNDNLRLELENNFNNKLSLKELELERLKALINETKTLKDLEYSEKVNSLNSKISELNNTITKITENNKLLMDLEISKIKEENLEVVYNLKEENENLKRERSSLNVKSIGENLEKWCDNEFRTNYLMMPDNITWEKDNLVVGGTKADFLYKVYLDNKKEVLLTSAILEMKSEDPNSVNKQNIDKILKKLDEDRKKKNLEYAILVSELDWHENNNVPVEKVLEYDKMFIVRPPYFMTVLNIITAFGYKYQDILVKKEEEKLKFKDTLIILEEFERLKDEILDNSVKHINTHVTNILKETENITKANLKIIESSNFVLETHLKTIINKINDFKIRKIVKDINLLD